MKLSKLAIITTFALLLTPTAFAQTATDGATQLRDSVKQKVDEELSQIKQAVSKKAFLGSISGKNEASLTLTTWTNQTRTVLVSTDSVIKLKNNKDGTPADLKSGDYILVMGDADSNNTLTAKRLLVVSEPATDPRTTLFGTVSKKTTSTLTLSTPKNESVDIKLTSATKYAGDTKAADVKEGSKVLILTRASAATPPAYTALNLYLYPAL